MRHKTKDILTVKSANEGDCENAVTESSRKEVFEIEDGVSNGKEFKDKDVYIDTNNMVTEKQLEALKRARAALKEKRIKRKNKNKKRIFRKSIFDEIFG